MPTPRTSTRTSITRRRAGRSAGGGGPQNPARGVRRGADLKPGVRLGGAGRFEERARLGGRRPRRVSRVARGRDQRLATRHLRPGLASEATQTMDAALVEGRRSHRAAPEHQYRRGAHSLERIERSSRHPLHFSFIERDAVPFTMHSSPDAHGHGGSMMRRTRKRGRAALATPSATEQPTRKERR